jgi:hypothetical protein
MYRSTVRSGKGSVFLLCRLSESDTRFEKYPRLPVLTCEGFVDKNDHLSSHVNAIDT